MLLPIKESASRHSFLLFVAIIAGAVTAYALPTILVNNFCRIFILL
ncbi:MAG: hypothetical protein L6U99_10465 [Clostridium sp.]|nr:MAG: hypothetical protein L6U99_10465 [Clostridium sp.]